MLQIKKLGISLLFVLLLCTKGWSQEHKEGYAIGYAVDIRKITVEKMQYAKSLGIQYIEIAGMSSLLQKDLSFANTKAENTILFAKVQSILHETGMQVWSVHMPFGESLDLSLLKETDRKKVIEVQCKLVDYVKMLSPKIILFHPSYYLGLQEREVRKKQLTKSVKSLYKYIHALGLQMVVENMLGPELLKGDRERPLMRTVQECQELFAKFPKNVGLAVDMCHISNPENLILAFGNRVKTLHVCDGNGKEELHYLPCNGKGENDWMAIFAALDQINYRGVFMYECKYKDEQELVDCYKSLAQQYQNVSNGLN